MNNDFFNAVLEMRVLQKQYLKKYSQKSKEEMIKAENKVDKFLKEYKQEKENELNRAQSELF